MVQLSNFANACIHQLSQGRGGMKLLAGTERGLSVGQKILLIDEQFALCNIIRAKQYYIDNYFKFIRCWCGRFLVVVVWY
jgi:ABC-type proline/glycine betaine transport system ATPase subunit